MASEQLSLLEESRERGSPPGSGRRWCRVHKRWEPSSAFRRKNPDRADGYQNACRAGQAEEARARRRKRSEELGLPAAPDAPTVVLVTPKEIARLSERIDVPLEECRRRVMAGERWCRFHGRWEPLSSFNRTEANSPDGFQYVCRAGQRERARRRRAGRDRLRAEGALARLPGRRKKPARDGDKRQAANRISALIDAGVLAPASTRKCSRCGHVHGTDGRRHFWVHTRGFAAEHHDFVEVLCSLCRGAFAAERKRAKARREGFTAERQRRAGEADGPVSD